MHGRGMGEVVVLVNEALMSCVVDCLVCMDMCILLGIRTAIFVPFVTRLLL